MKKTALISAAAAASFALALAPVASAEVVQRLDVKLTSSKAGTKSKPTSVGITVSTGTTTQNPDPNTKNTITYAKIFLPKGIKLNYKAFPACSDETTCADSAPKSAIGSGTASASVVGVDYNPTGTLTPFIGTSGRLLIRTQFTAPAVIDEPLIGKISTSGGGYAFDFNVPTTLQTPIPGADQQINDFTLKFSKKSAKKGSKKIGLVELNSCPKGGYVFKGQFQFKDGQTAATSTKVKCSAAKK